jgi:hypothetical protein
VELVIAIAASLAAPLAPAIAHGAPFFPGPEPVDHVVTMVVRNWGLEEGRVVTHHGGWTRVERSHRGGLGRSYFGQSGFTTVNLGGLNPGENRGVSIVRGAEAHLSFGWDYSSFKTGERRAVLGESCEVCNVSRTIRDSELANFSCVTADGIELASWLVTPRGIRHSAEATHLERRPVLPEDAQPPRGLLDLRSWMAPADAAASPESPGPEYDVVLETAIEPGPSTRTKNMRITRRNPNWMLNDTWRGNGRDLSIRHLATGLHVTAHSTTRGVFERLTIGSGADRSDRSWGARHSRAPIRNDSRRKLRLVQRDARDGRRGPPPVLDRRRHRPQGEALLARKPGNPRSGPSRKAPHPR